MQSRNSRKRRSDAVVEADGTCNKEQQGLQSIGDCPNDAH